MAPVDRIRKAMTPFFARGRSRRDQFANRRRRGVNEVAAEEYRRARRISPREHGEFRPLLIG